VLVMRPRLGKVADSGTGTACRPCRVRPDRRGGDGLDCVGVL